MKYFVYTHTILGRKKPFFIGKGTKKENGKTHKVQYYRAYSKTGRNKFWHKELVGKEYTIKIVYESSNETKALNKEDALKKLYGMRWTIKYGYGNNKYIKGKGCLVNAQEKEHRTNNSTGKVCPFCGGHSVWEGEKKNSYYCGGAYCEGGEGWTEGGKQRSLQEIEYREHKINQCIGKGCTFCDGQPLSEKE